MDLKMDKESSGLSSGKRQWEGENEVFSDLSTYRFDPLMHETLLARAPWTNNVHYFTKCRISACALIKMVMHARSGGRLEVMGLMQGMVVDDALIVLDVFALPVEGTETRVNAGSEANEYMVAFQESGEAVGRTEAIVGWYHSHPGYGCWLSGIDCQTQMLYQQHQDPFVAVVIDPIRTCAAGKVDIGAFRCYPSGHVPSDEAPSASQPIPLEKIEDFGLHWKQYYSLTIEVFKSPMNQSVLDILWAHNWASILSSSPIITNSEYYHSMIKDVVGKIDKLESICSGKSKNVSSDKQKNLDKELIEVAKLSGRAASERLKGMATEIVKSHIFCRPQVLETTSTALKQDRMDVD